MLFDTCNLINDDGNDDDDDDDDDDNELPLWYSWPPNDV